MTRYIILERKDILNLILGKKVYVEQKGPVKDNIKNVLIKESSYKKEIENV